MRYLNNKNIKLLPYLLKDKTIKQFIAIVESLNFIEYCFRTYCTLDKTKTSAYDGYQDYKNNPTIEKKHSSTYNNIAIYDFEVIHNGWTIGCGIQNNQLTFWPYATGEEDYYIINLNEYKA